MPSINKFLEYYRERSAPGYFLEVKAADMLCSCIPQLVDVITELCERRAVGAQTGLSQPGWDEALQIFGAASGSAVGRMCCTRQSSGEAVRRCYSIIYSPVRPWLHPEKWGPADFALKEMPFELELCPVSPQELCNEDQEAFCSALWPLHQQHRGFEHTTESRGHSTR